MTAAAAELTYDEDLIAKAAAVFGRARDLGREWPETDRDLIGETVRDLAKALKVYRDLQRGIVPAWFAGMKAGPGGHSRALKLEAENADEIAQVLAILLPACGTEGETK